MVPWHRAWQSRFSRYNSSSISSVFVPSDSKIWRMLSVIWRKLYVQAGLMLNNICQNAATTIGAGGKLSPCCYSFLKNVHIEINNQLPNDSCALLADWSPNCVIHQHKLTKGICFYILPWKNIQRIDHLTTASMADSEFGSNRRTATKKHFLWPWCGRRGCSIFF